MTKEISPIYLIWIPVLYFVLQTAFEIFMPGTLMEWYVSENGPVEIAQNVIIFTAFLVALFAIFSKSIKPLWLKAWFVLAALCCFYVAGEEVSWGQHIWDWSTPENWSQINDQQETNLHNTSSWLDQKPRLILLIGIVFGALVYPLIKKAKLINLPRKLDFLFPSQRLSVIAVLIVVPKILEKIFEVFDIAIFARFSEVEELYMFYFVLIYLIMLYQNSQNEKFS